MCKILKFNLCPLHRPNRKFLSSVRLASGFLFLALCIGLINLIVLGKVMNIKQREQLLSFKGKLLTIDRARFFPKAENKYYVDSNALLAKIVWDVTLNYTDRIVEQLKYKPKRYDLSKNISIFYSLDLDIPEGNEKFIKDKCSFTNCFVEKYFNKLKPIHFDAILMTSGLDEDLLKQRRPEDVYIWYNLESPLVSEVGSLVAFNWTATYRRDSTIVAPYEKFVQYKEIKDRVLLQKKWTKNYAKGKKYFSVAIISNCADRSQRMEIIKALSHYIPVDVYGGCGDKYCVDNDDCFNKVRDDYKFYFSFENALCDDYITEKLFRNALSYDAVPVVLGARKKDYLETAPPFSYIHAEDFKSIKDLAYYLKAVNSSDDLYNSYFRWKGTGEFIDTKFFCRLCKMLNDQDKPRMSMENDEVSEWWNRGSRICRESTNLVNITS